MTELLFLIYFPQWIAGHVCRVIYAISLVLCIALMATALGLMIYCLVEIEQTSISDHKVLSSTSEVYSLSAIERRRSNNLSLFTHRVCIEMIDSTKFDYENVKISLEKQRCADVSTEQITRTITSSVTSSGEVLEFYWIQNTNFSFNLNISDPGESTILYLHLFDDPDLSVECESGNHFPSTFELVFPYSTNSSSSKVNCTRVNDNLSICESSQVVVNTTGRYYMCMVFSKEPQPPTSVSYKLVVNEVRYDVNDPEPTMCRLNETNCCSTYGDLLHEAANPSCVFIRTESLEGDKKAKPLPPPFKIFTRKKWDGVLYSLYLIIILSVFPVIGVSLCCYTRYRKHHPGYCCRINV